MNKKELIKHQMQQMADLPGLEQTEQNEAVKIESSMGTVAESEADSSQEEISAGSLTRVSASWEGSSMDSKQYPEDPFFDQQSTHETMQLNRGTFQYDVTDFVLPGRDGFDLKMVRRYDSDCANLADMDPYMNGSDNLYTYQRNNNHYLWNYGLGYGWSFVLPSIEPVPSMVQTSGISNTYFSYLLHLEDGRTLSISNGFISFRGYDFGDVSIARVRGGKISHPTNRTLVKEYEVVVSYKDGKKDYFYKTYREYPIGQAWARTEETKYIYTLVAREDKFGNVIFFGVGKYGGMTITDTWGRTISLVQTTEGMRWTLPTGENGKTCTLDYQIQRVNGREDDENKHQTKISIPERLNAVIDPAGRQTTYTYDDPKDRTLRMVYASSKYKDAPKHINGSDRPYLLLTTITHPTGAKTKFDYGSKLSLVFGPGGEIGHYPLATRKEVVKEDLGEKIYHQVDYRYQLGEDKRFIQSATVTKHDDVIETHTFNEDGLKTMLEVKHAGTPITEHTYTYGKLKEINKNQMISAIEKTFQQGNKSLFLQKETNWAYDVKGRLNISVIKETHTDSSCDQETTIKYGHCNMITEKTWKKDAILITETNGLDSKKNSLVVKYKRIHEDGILKEKTEYGYPDAKSDHPYCVTSEKRYLQNDNQDLDQSSNYRETLYQYDSEKFTHAAVSTEVIKMRDVDGKTIDSIKETYDYDQRGRLIQTTDPNGNKSTIRYDILGRVIEETLPTAGGQVYTTKTAYNDQLNSLTQTDANQEQKRIDYTPLGQVSRIFLVSSDGQTADLPLQQCQYTAFGELEQVMTYDGTGTASNQIKKTEQYTYDSFGRVLTKSITETGYQETYQYDEVFTDPEDQKRYFREQKTIKGDNAAPDVVTTLFNDQKGLIRKTFLAGQRVATAEYDQMGNKISQLDDQNKQERWVYDYAGRVIKSIRMIGGQERVLQIEYDARGNKRFSWDEDKKKTEFQYDGADRLIKTIAPVEGSRNQITKYYYDSAGNLVWEKLLRDDGWQEVQHVYDERKRLTQSYQYLVKNPNTLTGANWIRTCYQYDVTGNITEMRTGDTPAGIGNQVTKYRYDRFGQVLVMTDARGRTEQYQYNKIGILQAKIDRNGHQTVYQRDALDRVVKETVTGQTADGAVISERAYGYSKSGQTIRDSSRQTEAGREMVWLETKYYFNAKGQLRRQEDPAGAIKEYTYDSHGNRDSFKLIRAGQNVADIHLYYTYDDLYRLTQVRKDSVTGTIIAEYDYDIKGNRKALRYPQSGIETSYRYNEANWVTAVENKKQGAVISAWEYVYHVDGNLSHKIDKSSSNPVTTSYRYDRLGRLIEENDAGWKRATYEYDAYSNRIRMTVEGKTKGETFAVTTYHYSLKNLLEKEIKKQGKTTETYQYRYDDNGNETFRIWEKTAPSPDYPGEVSLSGNRRRKDPTVYEWRQYNGFNQLIRIFQDDGEIAYQYRGDGMRHHREVSLLTESQGKTNVYYWDGTDIVAEQTVGEGINCYLRGLNLIARQTNGMLYYYLFNGHGDVTQLRDQQGNRVTSYEYDAFGNEKDLWEEDVNPFRYCGEYFDVETNTLYLRNRDYRSGTGRFTQHDTHWNPGNMIYGDGADGQDSSRLNTYTSQPNVHAMMQSGNGYVYGLNNPNLYKDSTGLAVHPAAAAALPTTYLVLIAGLVGWYVAIVTRQWIADNKDSVIEVLGESIQWIDDKIFSNGVEWNSTYNGYPIANPSNAMRGEANSDTEGESEADAIALGLSGIAGQYGIFKCKEAADAMADYMRKQKQEFKFITMYYPSEGTIISLTREAIYGFDSKKSRISENGYHYGIEYNGVVFCNVHPFGLPRAAWEVDFWGIDQASRVITPK